MVKLKEITAFLESAVPLDLQDSWDNSGLQVGWEEQEVEVVGFALSVSRTVLSEALREKVDLLITHHPVTISGVKSLVPFKYPNNLFLELAKKGVAVYSLHTNLDVSPLGPTAIIADELGLLDRVPIVTSPPYGSLGTLPTPLSQRELFFKLSEILEKDVYRVVGFKPENVVKKVAICSGSGASFIDLVAGKADVYVTGDVKYHDALKSIDLGLTLFDMGHFGTERLFYRKLKELLAKAFPSLKFKLLCEKSPFEVV
ncbi:Nif3-like dinuclear metal center hexameric protein [Phorcysia thermohydrogeniphila]|uniref:GTP cyclohydrolase 1 type 2 homolog n=1 Tax=Phorcysia thermohydrogeniphila TaxID=936138 RepID=A0A4R1GCV6_9BACT|nr:Nif3-like dinuclear metal center hexameric protein [Phorcysia thermohydrogeniphila]TCK04601.1 dinuclear metal center YbgI/SA1388 family protein [Phorcysia thermohydrogeniphila]